MPMPVDLPAPRPIRFFHQGAIREITDASPTRSVLDWLREDARCTGTKEGCNEGDCGACTVIVAELAGRAEATGTDSARAAVVGPLLLRTVNACLRFLPTLDGKALLTVEDLSPPGAGTLHPVQQALVDHHGSQCGFCTPGFVMSLTATYEHRQAQAGGRCPPRAELADALAGNLCRCTGYRPILEAGERMFELPVQRLDTAPIAAALHMLSGDPALHYAPAGHPTTFHAPRSVQALATLHAAAPDAQLMAGSTDIGLWVNKQFRRFDTLIATGEVAELQRIECVGHDDGSHTLRLGAAASLEDAWSALAARLPSLNDVWRRFASPPVRHAGTLGGNIANGSPIGDGAPVLMALDATVLLQHGERQRRVPLDRFYLGYMKNERQPGEFLRTLEVPLPAPDSASRRTLVRAWKVSKRHDSDISALLGAVLLVLDTTDPVAPVVAEVRISFGGMAATVCRAPQAEAALRGRSWDEAGVRRAMAALHADYQPMSDLRASARYRQRVAANLLWRLWLESRPDGALPAEQLIVWHGEAGRQVVTAD
ncbi:xanthine dehydrogenase small subunit [Sphaerotilus hippei]|uniref:Xanthine dehydrogenase small subunit n=2 Tax=Sphaerotilus hippei TaxID=744406 RepID=A0A318H1R0_9BURK|nr:xanthine dehydrogenase small subunit [Sphaerotilus hippei]PXW97075.1 xanthine dehydrogenase small subunit [Sphaerotilus hippei]